MSPIRDLLTVSIQLELAPFTTHLLLVQASSSLSKGHAEGLPAPFLGPQPTLFLVCLLLNMPFLYK